MKNLRQTLRSMVTPTISRNAEAEDTAEKDKPKKESKGTSKINCRRTRSHSGLDDLMCKEESIDATVKKGTLKWITRVYESSRGFELGTFDSSLLVMTMKVQTERWEALALAYINDIISMAHSFIVCLLKLLCPDLRMRDGLSLVLMEDLTKMYRKAIDHVCFLLRLKEWGRQRH